MLHMTKEPDDHLRPSLRTTLSMHVTWFCYIDDWLLMKWHIFCKLAMVRSTNWCTTNLGFIKSVQDGSQNNSQGCINKCAWTLFKNLDHYGNEWDILNRIITCDRTWVHHYEPESKWQSMEWKHPQLPFKKKFKTQPSAVFRDSQGPVLEHYQERGTTITSAWYSEMLTDWLKPAIQSKHRELLLKRVVLLHSNARPHTAAHTAETLWKLKFEVMAHPPYSPDLTPSDYHLFGPVKEALKSRWFTLDQEVKEAVHSWLAAQPKTFSLEGIRKLVQRWTKCIEKQGDYFQKWC